MTRVLDDKGNVMFFVERLNIKIGDTVGFGMTNQKARVINKTNDSITVNFLNKSAEALYW